MLKIKILPRIESYGSDCVELGEKHTEDAAKVF
jgi:hypothetical protein